MHSIVTGGAGFVGSHLCDHLLAKGHRVTCVDNLITGRKENIAHLRRHPGFRFIRRDVTRGLPRISRDMAKAFPRFLPRADYVFHLASPASPVGYMKNSIETILTNSMGSLRLLEYCRKRKAKFLFASTSEVYGNPAVHPQAETYWGNVNSFGPRSCYDESKRLGEALVYEYIHKYGVDARIIRIFNTYGPRLNENDGRVVSNLISQALRGQALTLYGDGSQTRSFCYVADLVAGIWAAISKEDTRGQIFNLGNPQETTIKDFAKVVLELCGAPGAKLVHEALPQDDPVRRKPDISKAKKVLGWEPHISLKEGLRQTIDYYRGRI
ncbi:MAG TPA: UDP-glucuronic acid decarboxylase family protein [bacterium]|nr:UDP-glucuronic acid decarboxylase family protein [bacterium]